MNPFKRFKWWIAGKALAGTDDVFEKARIAVLFNFTVFFLLVNIPYAMISISLSAFHKILATTQFLGFAGVLIVLKKTGNVKWGVLFYLFNHTVQNLAHYFINNGRIETVGILFFILYIFFAFLLLDRTWGFGLTAFILFIYIAGIYNINSNFALFHVAKEYADPDDTQTTNIMSIIPILLNVYLVSEFVKTRQIAEERIAEQKSKLEVKNKDITDSILYARRIQRALTPSEKYIETNLNRLNKKKE